VHAFRVSWLVVVVTALVLAAGAAASPARHANPPCDPNCGPADLLMQGSVSQTTVAVGDALVWYLQVNDQNQGPATGVYVDITLPTNVSLVSTYSDRGTGCTSTGATTLHCDLDWLADTAPLGHVTVTTKVTGTGNHALTAVAGYRAPDITPADNTVTITATTPAPPPVVPVIATGTVTPTIVASGKRAVVSFVVTRSDNNAPLTAGGTLVGSATVGGKSVASLSSLGTDGIARVQVKVPNRMKGNKLRVSVTVTTSDGSASKNAAFKVRK